MGYMDRMLEARPPPPALLEASLEVGGQDDGGQASTLPEASIG
jgi:hypothetical protein